MYRVIVIDDEPWALLGIRNAFDWTAHNMGIIAECTDAEEAFQLICKEHPDIVFTDIRMPKYNGIDLMRMVRELELDTEFVVISGFAEFIYVQEALKYGALDYCLKPINPETTNQLLEKVIKHIKNKQSLKSNLLMEALTGQNHSELHHYNPKFFGLENCYWHALIVFLNAGSGSFPRLKVLEGQDYLGINMNSRKKLYIVKNETAGLKNEEFLDIKADPFITSVGISSKYGTLEDIPKIIKEADIAALQGFVSAEAELCFYKDEKKWVKPFLGKLQSELENSNFDRIEEYLGMIKKEFRDKKLGMNEAVYLWNQVIGIIMNQYKDEEQIEGLEYLNYLELCDRFKDFNSMISFIHEAFCQFDQKTSLSMNPNEMIHYFDQLLKYIDQHYNQELYIKDLSEKFYINQFTCYKMFKKILGKTFTEYVTGIRINKACQLIKTTEMTIEEIAFKVGYSDYFYFNKVFKKHCGLTPAKYKRN